MACFTGSFCPKNTVIVFSIFRESRDRIHRLASRRAFALTQSNSLPSFPGGKFRRESATTRRPFVLRVLPFSLCFSLTSSTRGLKSHRREVIDINPLTHLNWTKLDTAKKWHLFLCKKIIFWQKDHFYTLVFVLQSGINAIHKSWRKSNEGTS